MWISASLNDVLTLCPPVQSPAAISVDEQGGHASSEGQRLQMVHFHGSLPSPSTPDTPKNTLIESTESTVGLEKRPRLCHPGPRMGQNRQANLKRPIRRPPSFAFVPVVPSVPETLKPNVELRLLRLGYGLLRFMLRFDLLQFLDNQQMLRCYGSNPAPTPQDTPAAAPSIIHRPPSIVHVC